MRKAVLRVSATAVLAGAALVGLAAPGEAATTTTAKTSAHHHHHQPGRHQGQPAGKCYIYTDPATGSSRTICPKPAHRVRGDSVPATPASAATATPGGFDYHQCGVVPNPLCRMNYEPAHRVRAD